MTDLKPEPPETPALQKIKISKLFPHPFQCRKQYEPEILEGMQEAIRNNLGPDGKPEFPQGMAITVRQTMRGHNIISGHTRTEAAKREGLYWVWAIVQDYKSDEDAALAVLLANNQKELRMDEVGLHAKNMKAHYGWNYSQFATRTKRQYQYVMSAVKLHELCERFPYLEDRIKRMPPTTILKVLDIKREQQSVTDRLQFDALRYTLEEEPTGKMLDQIVKLVNDGMEVGEAFETILSGQVTADQIVIQASIPFEHQTTTGTTYNKQAAKAVKQANKLLKDSSELIDKQLTRIQELEAENNDLRQDLQEARRELEELRELSGLDAE